MYLIVLLISNPLKNNGTVIMEFLTGNEYKRNTKKKTISHVTSKYYMFIFTNKLYILVDKVRRFTLLF